MAKETLKVSTLGVLTYAYESEGGECFFAFNLLCEVGAPYQQWFKDEIRRRRLKVRTVELPYHPWLVDVCSKWRNVPDAYAFDCDAEDSANAIGEEMQNVDE